MSFDKVLIQEINGHQPTFLTRCKRGYICPKCNNGAGTSGTGLELQKTTGRYHCFVCGLHADVVELWGVANNVTSFPERVKGAAAYYGLEVKETDYIDSIDNLDEEILQAFGPDTLNRFNQARNTPTIAATQEQDKYTEFYKVAVALWDDKNPNVLKGREYLAKRGISVDTAKNYGVGFWPNWTHPDYPNAPETDRIIFPASSTNYSARAIDDQAAGQYKKQKVGKQLAFFNEAALYQEGQPVFILEGEFDALSVLEIGGNALALNSVNNVKKLLEKLGQKRTANTVIIALDNDGAGAKAAQELKQGLDAMGIHSFIGNIAGKYKDANEALVNDREAFVDSVFWATEQAERPDNMASYLLSGFDSDIQAFKQSAVKSTGFSKLDKLLNGGFYSGLYVLAAASSLGKTTFCLQVADQLAANGQDVIFFSLEQSRLEMLSKSLSRITAQIDKTRAAYSLSIRNGLAAEIVKQAKKMYCDTIGGNLSVVEGNFKTNITSVINYVKNYVTRTGRKPIVFVDYLQILQAEQSTNIRENINSVVTELRMLARDLNITIVVISSINRANYLTPIDFESLKESGGIEYTADVILGLQLHCLQTPLFTDSKTNDSITKKRNAIKEAKAAMPREIDLVCLKNRYGIATFTAEFEYTPQYDLYEETQGDTKPKGKKIII